MGRCQEARGHSSSTDVGTARAQARAGDFDLVAERDPLPDPRATQREEAVAFEWTGHARFRRASRNEHEMDR